jgi:hypothetical protein
MGWSDAAFCGWGYLQCKQGLVLQCSSASVTPATTPDAPTGIAITTENTNHGYSSI